MKGSSVIDSTYVLRTPHTAQYRKAIEEQKLVDQYLRSKSSDTPANERIEISGLTVDQGMLRRRLSTDPRDVRVNAQGQQLAVTLLTSPSPPSYRAVAQVIAQQWRDLGVLVSVDIPATSEEFEQRMLRRNYDVLLFGQSLLDNLDSYPYWHSSNVQRYVGGGSNLRLDAYNLSQYTSQRSDHLLTTIRETVNERERLSALEELRRTLAADVPAIFLYSPLYTFAVSPEVSGVSLGSLSLHSDRFLTLERWYVRKDRALRPGVSWLSVIPWIFRGAR
jgi:peptide/nickel transport system substrate-binding protein